MADSSSDSTGGLEYDCDVFLSFSPDTRHRFVDHLLAALAQAGLHNVFVHEDDTAELRSGSEIAPAELLTAIEKSKVSVVILSQVYASSSWCLDELVKILECSATLGHLVVPVFYQLDPSDVREQRGRCGEAFSELTRRYSDDRLRVQRWTAALVEVGSMSSPFDGISDSSLVSEIVNTLLKKLHKAYCLPPPADPIDPPLFDSTAVRNLQYDVFISFRGEDTRNNFTSHLYAALARQNLRAFVDAESMRRDAIAPVHLKAIEESRSSVIVFSKEYASSEWCLDELVKILDCRRNLGQLVVPVFYHVDPSDVRRQLGRSGKAFAKLTERTADLCKVRTWKDALVEVSSLMGWATCNMKSESFLLHEIVTNLSEKLSQSWLVGVDSRIREVLPLLGLGSFDVRTVGIYGGGGIGKTTLAKAVYDRIRSTFNASCFMANFREYSENFGISGLQRQILSKYRSFMDDALAGDTTIKKLPCAKVLLVLDDVRDTRELASLSGRCHIFGPGSRIIVVTRNKHVLTSSGINFTYKVKALNTSESLQLFSRIAFRQCTPEEGRGYRELSVRVVKYASGVPLALKVLGSSLYGRSKRAFESILGNTEIFADVKVPKALHISFDGLDDDEKDIFLDIAFFFEGQDVGYVKEFLNGCGFSSEIGIAVLVDKGLLTISDNRLMMPDLVRDMAISIVRQENIDGGKRSRLWDRDDVHQVLTRNTGTGTIEGISLDLSKAKEMHWPAKVFSKMHNLRIFKIFSPSVGELSKVHLPDGLDSFPSELRLLHWHGYPLKSLPTKFFPENLIELYLPFSHLERLWEGTKVFPTLKRMWLSYSQKLIEAPQLSVASNLEKLSLEGCVQLAKFPSPDSCMINLVILIAKGCTSLQSMPDMAKLEALETMDLSGCSKLREIPQIPGSLKELFLSGIDIIEVPTSISRLGHLVTLDLENCTSLESLPANIKKLSKLERLELSDCWSLKLLPELPASLKYLDAHNCRALEAVSTSSTVNGGTASNFIFSNCFKLDHTADCNFLSAVQCPLTASMEAYKGLPRCPSVSMCFPGSEIPGWFDYSSLGSSITIELPPPSRGSWSVGFVLCAVVSFKDYEDDGEFNIRSECCFHSNNGCTDLIGYSGGWFGRKGKPRVIGKEHVFLWFDSFELHGHSALSFDFFPTKNHRSPLHSCEVKNCGLHPISYQSCWNLPSIQPGASDISGSMEEASTELRKDINPRKKKIRTSSWSRRNG